MHPAAPPAREPGPLIRLLELLFGGDRAAVRRWLTLVVISAGADLAIIYCIMVALRHQRAGLPDTRELALFCLLVTVWYVSNRGLRRQTHQRFTAAADRLYRRLVEHLGALSLERFEATPRSGWMARLTTDVQRLARAAFPVIAVGHGCVRLVIGAAVVFWLAPSLALPAALALFVLGIAATMQAHTLQMAVRAVSREEVALYGAARDQVDGAVSSTLHAGRADSLQARFRRLSARIHRLRVDAFGLLMERQHASTAALYAILGLNIFIVPLVLVTDAESLRDTNLVLVRLVFSVAGLAFGLPGIAPAYDAYLRLDDILRPSDPPGSARPPVTAAGGVGRDFEQIEMAGALFRYDGGFACGPVDLTLRRGEIVFVVGPNGSGKSTLLKMLTGLYPLHRGELRVDGEPVTEQRRGAHRTLFSPIPTRHHLLERVPEGADPTQVTALLAELGLTGQVDVVDGRLTRRDLSTGQKRRTALLVARLRDRPVMVLDEWAADQDPGYRAWFYRDLLPQLKAEGRLVVVASHDDRYFDCADRMLVVEGGRVRETDPTGDRS